MTTTQSQAINALAYVMSHVRPEWDTPGCVAALRRAPDVDFSSLAIAAIRCAGDPRNDTPEALTFIDNRAWDEDRAWACKAHPNTRARRTNGECAACWSDRQERPAVVRDRGGVPMPQQAKSTALAAISASIRSRQTPPTEERKDEEAVDV